MRRKTLAKNLKACFSVKNEEAKLSLENAGLDKQVRGEVLTLEEIAALTEAFAAVK